MFYFLFLSFYSSVLPLLLCLHLSLLHRRKGFVIVKMDIKYVSAVKIMQVNIRSKLVRCKRVTDVLSQPLRKALLSSWKSVWYSRRISGYQYRPSHCCCHHVVPNRTTTPSVEKKMIHLVPSVPKCVL